MKERQSAILAKIDVAIKGGDKNALHDLMAEMVKCTRDPFDPCEHGCGGSCSGHVGEFFISFTVETLDQLATIARLLEDEPSYRLSWKIEASYGGKLWFALVGPRGASGDLLAKALRSHG